MNTVVDFDPNTNENEVNLLGGDHMVATQVPEVIFPQAAIVTNQKSQAPQKQGANSEVIEAEGAQQLMALGVLVLGVFVLQRMAS